MKVYTKNYIGKGTQVVTGNGTQLDIVKVVLSVEEMLKFAHEYEGKQFVSFEVSKMRKPDDYKNTHTVYHTTYGEEIVEPTTPEPKAKRGRPTKAQIAEKLEAAKKIENHQDLVDPKKSKEQQALKAEMQMANADIPRENTPF